MNGSEMVQPEVSPLEKPRGDKFEDRRGELADATLQTLSELGYARTSLREIAQHSKFSHGVLHYYFTDKVELISYCVQRYKVSCVARYDQIVSQAQGSEELRHGFAEALTLTLLEDTMMHRLWYDLRGQSLFETAFREDVAAIDLSLENLIYRIVGHYADLNASQCAFDSATTYAMLDGLFQQALLKHLYGYEPAAVELRAAVEELLPRLLIR
ncbi:TetR/AcrR family transcriptional regulator [Psychromicrobium sp. YIM B11713]|uniref:TetR/AcrR family transcriptional regulator n=1 Tax=Psychromicrobium sp. YIM B11713 TaxID=3145233 RepID=UPI00374F6C81